MSWVTTVIWWEWCVPSWHLTLKQTFKSWSVTSSFVGSVPPQRRINFGLPLRLCTKTQDTEVQLRVQSCLQKAVWKGPLVAVCAFWGPRFTTTSAGKGKSCISVQTDLFPTFTRCYEAPFLIVRCCYCDRSHHNIPKLRIYSLYCKSFLFWNTILHRTRLERIHSIYFHILSFQKITYIWTYLTRLSLLFPIV